MPIRVKLAALFLSIAVIPMLFTNVIIYTHLRNILREQIITGHHHELRMKTEGIIQISKRYRFEILLVRDLPPLLGMLRSRETGVDPQDGSTLAEWKERFEMLLSRMIKADQNIDQLGYIDQDGNESVSVQREGPDVKVLDQGELQNEAHLDYFQAAIATPKDHVYTSPLGLKKNTDQTGELYQPVLRFAAPVFTEDGDRAGIVMIGIRMSSFLEDAATSTEGSAIVTDQDGYFIFHPESRKAFSRELGSGHNYFEEQPELVQNIQGREFKDHYDAEEKQHRIWRKIYYDEGDQTKYLIFFSVLQEDLLFSPITQLRNTVILMAVISLFVVVLLAFSTAQTFLRPLKALHRGTEIIGGGNLDHKVGTEDNDEIGQLSRAFDRMVARLKTVTTSRDQLNQQVQKHMEAEERFRRVIESSPHGVVVVNHKGEIILVNHQTEKMFRYTRQELVGQLIEVLVPRQFRKEHPAYRTGFFERPKVREMGAGRDLYGLRKDGSEFPVEIGLSPLKMDGNPVVLSAIVDISLRKRAEERLAEEKDNLEKVNLELDSFVYTASHDLRAPLRGIASFTTFLEQDYQNKLDANGKDHLQEIRKAVYRMSQLIDDLLTLSRISRIRNPYEEVGMDELLGVVLKRVEFEIKEKRAHIKIQDPLPKVFCDRIKMTEVWVNLIGNAIKFSSGASKENPEVGIGYHDEEGYYDFYVKDNGIGIDPQYHQQIFDVFKRLHAASEYEGTGTGLNIVKRVIEGHGGRVWVVSQLGKGAIFHFTLLKSLRRKDHGTDIKFKA
jgi:PAS domain S-box-containing protein